MGFFKKVGKTIKKGWKDTFGWADDKETIGIAAPIVLGALTGGIGFAAAGMGGMLGLSAGATGAILGGAAGAIQGAGNLQAMKSQEKAQKAELAAAQRIADAQNPANLVTATTPTAQVENAQISEENMESDASRRYSFNKTLYKRRSSKLGSSGDSSGAKNTLG